MESKKCFFLTGIFSVMCFFGISYVIHTSFVKEKDLFRDYIEKFNKTYDENDREYFRRFENFKKSLRTIAKLNEISSINSHASYGLTIFSDLSQNEFIKNYLKTNYRRFLKKSYTDFKYDRNSIRDYKAKHFTINSTGKLKRSIVLPQKIDWRKNGIITKVHSQMMCGACWAFSTIETVEAMYALKVGSLVQLSVQQMIDCAEHGNHGCEGGDSCLLLRWLLTTKTKVTTEKKYPFSYKTELCKSKNFKSGVQIKNFSCDNFVGDENKILEKLAFHGPVVAAVNALNWQYYLGGIIQFHCSGAPEKLNHAVQIVGFDNTAIVPYYIVRNSWGPQFGDNGYLYIAIGGNICGLANQVTSLEVV